MKIEGPKRTDATGKTDKTKKTSRAGGASFSEFLTESEGVESARGPAPVTNVSLYVALQVAETATEQENKRRAIERTDDLLSELDDLRIGLLLGNYTKSQLERLGMRLRQQRLTIQDPKLKALLDDVELRAAVELAKYE
jgi:hypothetical protein